MQNNAPSYAVRAFQVPPGESIQVYRQSNFLTCLEGNIAFKVAFDGNSASDFETGLTYREARGFTQVEIINPDATTTLTVKLAFGKGDVNDARLVISGAINAKIAAPETFATGAPISATDAATTLLAAENGNRAEIIISNDGSGKVYIAGNAGAVAGEGLPVDAGGTLVLTTTAAVYARNDSGAAVPVAVAELERV